MRRLVFLGAGRRVQLLRAFQEARRAAGLLQDLEIVATDVDLHAPALRHADRAILLPPISSAEHDPALHAVLDEVPSGLFPLIDPYVPVAVRLGAEGYGTAWTVGRAAALVTGDKWLTAKYFVDHDIPGPQTWLEPPDDPVWPVIVKPRGGSAGEDVFVARSASELGLFRERVPNSLVQQYLSGPEITVDLACLPGGELMGIGMRRRIRVRGGEVAVAVTVWDARIATFAERIVETLKPNGPITIQCFLLEDGPWFTEINARFGGGVPLSFEAGMDVLPAICRVAAGLPAALPERRHAAAGWRMSRYDEAYYDPPHG